MLLLKADELRLLEGQLAKRVKAQELAMCRYIPEGQGWARKQRLLNQTRDLLSQITHERIQVEAEERANAVYVTQAEREKAAGGPA